MSTAMQGVGGERHSSAMSIGSGYGGRGGSRGSISGAQPISMSGQNKPRRESLAGSMVTGMSWGGQSVGSWIRDDIIMQGTSPFSHQSQSFHSSSYQPKLEADFMRDFSCCGLTLPSLHDLLEHYEDNHHQQMRGSSTEGPLPDPKAAIATNAAAAIKDPKSQQQIPKTATPQRSNTPIQSQKTPTQTQSFAVQSSQEDETVGTMEMDDDFSQPQMQQYAMNPPRPVQRSQFGQPAQRTPQLDMGAVNGNNAYLQHQGLKHSPTTPANGNRPYYQHNPTVSSVNTPTLTAGPSNHPLQQEQFYTPQSSAPGTPRELDANFIDNMNQMSMSFLPNATGFNDWNYQPNNEMLDLCIDEPAKRLFARNDGTSSFPPITTTNTAATSSNGPTSSGTTSSAPASAVQLGDGQYSENSTLAKTIRQAQADAGVPDPSADGIPKPFHCPVIGCEKAYKNQNGLKYHKQHGHNTQTLQSNSNGTFSIVDPDTLVPFEGTRGMERLKPYMCQSCGKRYKNLNGLKYHKAHSSGCDPEICYPKGVDGVAAGEAGANIKGGGRVSKAGSKRNSLIMATQEEKEGARIPVEVGPKGEQMVM
ncbi:uncharacterized protein KY384_001655 [Bacidia gigantensis]|uniref:uncharacterized protein n=1 Tax=Bacidia gigantensis TaxID=2732470 RepID=UPI001D04E795|nr:uncharacterized protein KY384_001655 [Bacidia gigantensis]KAG8533914.1 hypothetical protein KY384_001655 [Bacidia gigantensis]